MRQLIIISLLTVFSGQLLAQENHYQRALRSQDTEYGLTQEPHFNGSGMFWLAISSEKIGFYEDAEWAYKKASETGYVIGDKAHKAFKQRMKQRKAEEKQRKKEEKKRLKEK